MKVLKSIKQSRSFYTLVGLVVLMVLGFIFSEDFRKVKNLITILQQTSTLLVLSIGLTAVLLIGNMDLSVGATAGFIGCTCAQLLKLGWSVPMVFLAGVAMGVVVGAVNGVLVSVVKLPGFIATYAINWAISGLSIIVMNGSVVYDLPPGFTYFGTGYVGMIPIIVIIAAVVSILAYILLQKTTFGRTIFYYGSNHKAAQFSGISVKKTVILTFIFCSVCAGIGGLLMTARLNAAEAAMGNAYGLQMVAAVVIGGTSMLGGEGGVVGTVIGSLFLTIVVNLMNLMDISSFAQPMVVGIVILAMVLFDSYSSNRAKNAITA